MRLSLILLLLGHFFWAGAQTIGERHDFARTYFGLDWLFTPGYEDGSYLNASDATTPFERGAFLTPAINIGGTHFWGYADIYISITTSPINLTDQAVDSRVRYGVFTGFRLYPLRLTPGGGLRPFLGYKFSPIRYLQEDLNGQEAINTLVKSVVDLGLGYQTPRWYFYAGYNRLFNPDTEIALSRTNIANARLPSQFFNIGANYTIETTKGADNQVSRHFDALFGQSIRRGLFLGIGPSAAFPIADSKYLDAFYPFLDQRTMARIFPEVTVGYHFTKPDIITNITFRPIVQQRAAFGFDQEVRRLSTSLEAGKFLFDYHGFAPFVGLGLGWENLRLQESDEGAMVTDISENQLTPLLTFGWDIRPTRNGDPWMLRTNLRWSPFLELEHRGQNISLQQLEFNFIQFVWYPQRAKAYREYQPN